MFVPGECVFPFEAIRRRNGEAILPLGSGDENHWPEVLEHHGAARLCRFSDFEKDPHFRKWNLWGYIDARDASQAIRLALEAPLKGADVFVIANADTVMSRSTSALLAEIFPGLPVRKNLGSKRDTPLDRESTACVGLRAAIQLAQSEESESLIERIDRY